MTTTYYTLASLEDFTRRLFVATGMESDKADCLARLLVRTDAMGRSTHGMAQIPAYLKELEEGRMAKSGEPEVLKDNGTSALWDGRYLPGHWLVEQAILRSIPRAKQYGLAAVSIKRNHHIGSLATLTEIATQQGCIAMIFNSDPAGKRAAPFGGTEALFTPNPLAIGYPATTNPVLVDISATITTTSMTRQKYARGEQFDQPWLLDSNGTPTRDPAVLEHATPRGSMQFLGGIESGHKGFGLALMVEALSQGLSGEGRKNGPTRWGGNTFVQVISPDAFGGSAAFAEQMDYLSEQSRANKPADPDKPVRMPGDNAARGLAKSKLTGLALDASVWAGIKPYAEKLGVDLPK